MFFLTFRYCTFKIPAKFSVVLPIIKMSTIHSHEEFQKFQNVLWPKSSRYHLSRQKKITSLKSRSIQLSNYKWHKGPNYPQSFELWYITKSFDSYLPSELIRGVGTGEARASPEIRGWLFTKLINLGKSAKVPKFFFLASPEIILFLRPWNWLLSQ